MSQTQSVVRVYVKRSTMSEIESAGVLLQLSPGQVIGRILAGIPKGQVWKMALGEKLLEAVKNEAA